MKTEMLIVRELFGQEIRQRHKSRLFSATDLVKAGNRWRINNGFEPFNLTLFLSNKSTVAFIKEIEIQKQEVVLLTTRGRNAQTWVHPLLFIDIALAIHPKLKVEMYDWIMDTLCEYRDLSGDSFKKMTGALWQHHGNKRTFKDYMTNLCHKIRLTCNVEDWQKATVGQLKLRDAIHEDIAWLASTLTHNDKAVDMALSRHRKSLA